MQTIYRNMVKTYKKILFDISAAFTIRTFIIQMMKWFFVFDSGLFRVIYP